MRPTLTLRFASACTAAAAVLILAMPALAQSADAQQDAASEKKRRLPFLGEEARKRGIELPPPFGIGVVYYHLDRAILVEDVRVGRNGAPPQSVTEFAQFGANARVDNVNLKFDVWLLPFFNLYAIVGRLWNESTTEIDVTLPPLLPSGNPRRFQLTVPTELEGTVGGIGATVAGGYGPLFFVGDVNAARADLGFDESFKAVVTSLRAGWNGQVRSRPFRTWLNATYWDTATEATGTVADPDGGTLAFEVDQGPLYVWTYGVGCAWSPRPWLDLAIDVGSDTHGGWYVALVPVYRF